MKENYIIDICETFNSYNIKCVGIDCIVPSGIQVKGLYSDPFSGKVDGMYIKENSEQESLFNLSLADLKFISDEMENFEYM